MARGLFITGFTVFELLLGPGCTGLRTSAAVLGESFDFESSVVGTRLRFELPLQLVRRD